MVLGFHVDYWDYLGWRDPYAQRVFSDRQRAINAPNGTRFVYTPQLIFEGKDYRRAAAQDDIADRIGAANRRTPSASIVADLSVATVVQNPATGAALPAMAMRTCRYIYIISNRYIINLKKILD